MKGTNVELTVSELAQAIKRALEGGFGHVRLRGEISGYRGQHSSGHSYFSLKDEGARIDAVIWRGVFNTLRFKPSEGLEVIATGRVTTYPGSSKYQIVVEALEPAGAGALMALLEERKKQLAAEGLFATERKRPLPFLPRVVGIVTSPTGAVIRDMLHGFEERFPTRVLVWPVRVQGDTSAAEIAGAIRGFNTLLPGDLVPRPDVLIVARGGGSLEDLWSFNEEIVVRAAAASAIPIISAVGHETDWTLLDLAADARAPTPTKAAEWAVPKLSDLLQQTGELTLRLGAGMRRTLTGERTRLRAAASGLPRPQELIALPRQRFDSAASRLPLALRTNTHVHANQFGRVASRLSGNLVRVRLTRSAERAEVLSGLAARAIRRRLETARSRLDRSAARLRPQAIAQQQQRGRLRLSELGDRLRLVLLSQIAGRSRAVSGLAQVLNSLSHRSVLERGFAIVRGDDGQMLRDAARARKAGALDIEFADGHVVAHTDGAVARVAPPRPAGGKPAANTRQGKLF